MRWVITVTIRAESDLGELDLVEKVDAAIWQGLTPLVSSGELDEVSHVDADAEEEGEL